MKISGKIHKFEESWKNSRILL